MVGPALQNAERECAGLHLALDVCAVVAVDGEEGEGACCSAISSS
jgi:hypothetical protein